MSEILTKTGVLNDTFQQEQIDVVNQSEELQIAIQNTTTSMEDLDKIVSVIVNPTECSGIAMAFYFGTFYNELKAKLENILQYLESRNEPNK